MMDYGRFNSINEALRDKWNKCQYALNMDGFGRAIDEMSVLLTSEDLSAYKQHAMSQEQDPSRRGMFMRWFNGTRDEMVMETSDDRQVDGPSFQVEFQFFRGHLSSLDEVGYSWRVEAMAVLDGYAPLHDDPSGRIVHASYKLTDPVEYEKELGRLRELGLGEVAHYRNSYGRFSYWEHTGLPWGSEGRVILLKPRVNLRDTVSLSNNETFG